RPLQPVPSESAHREFLVKIKRASVYLDEQLVLADVDWEVDRGEHWVIYGPNGSGKSTLAKLAAGLLHPAYGGRVRHFGSERQRICGNSNARSRFSPTSSKRRTT